MIEECIGVEEGIQRVVWAWPAKIRIVEVVGVRHGVLRWRMFGTFGLGSMRIPPEVHSDCVDSCIGGRVRCCLAVDVSVSLGMTKGLVL